MQVFMASIYLYLLTSLVHADNPFKSTGTINSSIYCLVLMALTSDASSLGRFIAGPRESDLSVGKSEI